MIAKEHTSGISKEVDILFDKSEKDPEYKKFIEERLTYNVGRKLFLEVEVTDKMLSSFLFNWMYTKDQSMNNMEYFGCKLHAIYNDNPKNNLKEKILELLNSE